MIPDVNKEEGILESASLPNSHQYSLHSKLICRTYPIEQSFMTSWISEYVPSATLAD